VIEKSKGARKSFDPKKNGEKRKWGGNFRGEGKQKKI